MPTLQWGDSTETESPDFSAPGAVLQAHGMTGELQRRKGADSSPVGRRHSHKPTRNFHVIGQPDQSTPDSSIGTLHAGLQRPRRESLKRIFDILGVGVLGIIFSPVILVVAVMLRCEGAPILFRHRRIGRNGQAFDCLKFRSMVPDADRALRELLEQHPELKAEWVRDHKLRDDPRVTALGRFLRRTSLDELPQLWNVVRGEMSLVGPRPVVREETLRYGRHLHRYLSARPGVTGLWQVMGRNDTNYRRRVVLDVCYIRRQSLLLDLFILVKTTRVVLGCDGAY